MVSGQIMISPYGYNLVNYILDGCWSARPVDTYYLVVEQELLN
jgi:hypothetical protein